MIAELHKLRVQPPAAVRRPADVHIRLAGVQKVYQTKSGPIPSLRPIDFDVLRHEFVAIVGPSGCGKSTLLKLVAGLLPATAGTISINDQQVNAPLDDVGIVFQSPVLLPWRTVRDNVLLQIQMRGRKLYPYLEKADDLLRMTGLEGFASRFPWELSGGMQQRVSICRALVHDPSVLLMDEPFGALDAMTRERMNDELQQIWMKTHKTVLLITHSIPEAVYLADRVVVMSERPGGVEAIYDVDLARPRDLSIMGDAAFADLTRRVRSHFHARGADH